MEPTDARLAAVYDSDNPDGPDHDFFRALVDRVGPRKLVDLGCGTGLLTVTLASADRVVIGIDPDSGMLDVARSRPGSERVRWLLGDSRQLVTEVDLLLMTGNVAQHIDPVDWQRTLADISSALRPGGVLAFETRNPQAQAWRSWTPEQTIGTRPTADGPLTEWVDSTDPDEHGTIVGTATNRWQATGEELVVRQPLTFRSRATIELDLTHVGLDVDRIWGGWHGESFRRDSPVMVVESRRGGAGQRPRSHLDHRPRDECPSLGRHRARILAGLAQLMSWASIMPDPPVETVYDALDGTVEAIVSAFSELIGLWPDL